MNDNPSLDESLKSFRLAAREIFNLFFRVSDPYNSTERAYAAYECFDDVQSVLFQGLITKPFGLPPIAYGYKQPAIFVDCSRLLNSVMINRELNSGYWDHPMSAIPPDARVCFVSYFDWDQLGYRDYAYVAAEIEECASHPELLRKRILIQATDVYSFELECK